MSDLHVLLSNSAQTPSRIAESNKSDVGDMFADLRSFPPRGFLLSEDGNLDDIGKRLLGGRDYWQLSRDWLTTFTRESGLQDMLSINGYGVWWSRNCLKFIPGLSKYGNIFANIDLLTALREETRPSQIYTHGEDQALFKVLAQIYPETPMQEAREQFRARQPKRRASRRLLLLLARIAWSFVGLLYLLICRPEIGFFSNTNFIRLRDGESSSRFEDAYMGDIAAAIAERGWSHVFIERYGWNASWRGLIARGLFYPTDFLILLTKFRVHVFGLQDPITKRWIRKWNVSESQITENLNYNGVSLSSTILPLVKNQFSVVLPSLESIYNIWLWLLKIWRPKVLFINCSYCESALPAIIAAKHLGIRTIEQQHGVIGKYNMTYLIPDEISLISQQPLCDSMIVWGAWSKRLLVESGVYNERQVYICGSPRIDRLLGSLPSPEVTKRALMIETNRSVALYTSNLLAEGVRGEILDGLSSVSDMNHVFWLVKLHPREDTRLEWEESIASRNIHNAKVIKGDYDFYTLLGACDIHVSLSSTTILEAALLGKVNLGLDIDNMIDPVGFSDVNAYKSIAPNMLGTEVSGLLKDTSKLSVLRREQRQFANDWCLFDGNSLSRIVAIVETALQVSDNTQMG